MLPPEPNLIYQSLGFPELKNVATLLSIAHLFKKSDSRCGIYLLEFPENKYYIGQAIDAVKRFSQHRKNYSNILGHSFIPIKKINLDKIEKELIQTAENSGITLLNVVHVSNVVGDTDLDLVISPGDQDTWLNEPFETNKNRYDQLIKLNDSHISRFEEKYSKFRKHQHYDITVNFVSNYINNCIPHSRVTEYSFWSVSCLPGTNINTWPRLTCLNIAVMEMLVIGYQKKNPGQLWGFVNVASDVLLNSFGSFEKFNEEFPDIELIERNYRDAGQHQIMLHAMSTDSLSKLLHSKDVLGAAATINMRVMRKRATIYQKFHCKQLANEVQTIE